MWGINWIKTWIIKYYTQIFREHLKSFDLISNFNTRFINLYLILADKIIRYDTSKKRLDLNIFFVGFDL